VPQKLSSVTLDEVSLVDNGANQKSRVVLTKRKDETCKGEGCDVVEKAPEGIQFVIGFKEEGGSEVQSIIFDSDKWSKKKAQLWLESHDFDFDKVDETENTLRFRQEDPEDFIRFRTIKPGSQIAKALRNTTSFGQITNAIDRALRDKFQKEGDPTSYLWVRDVYRDYAVFDEGGKTWWADYKITYDGGVPRAVVGDREEVVTTYQPVAKAAPITEGGNAIPPNLLVRFGEIKSRIEDFSQQVKKINHCHVPSGPKGGQFCSGGRGGGAGAGGAGGGGRSQKGGKKPNQKTPEGRLEAFKGNARPEAKEIISHMEGQSGWRADSTGTAPELPYQKASFTRVTRDDEHYVAFETVTTDRKGNWSLSSNGMFKGDKPSDMKFFEDKRPKYGSGLASLKEALSSSK
jgi:hypothetical protein